MTEQTPTEDPRRIEGDCIRCPGALVRGYGRVRVNGKRIRAHRAAFLREHGWLPPVVRHTCDNTWCINVLHLREGTQRDNVQDRVDRDRSARRERNGRAKLTEDQVAAIRERYAAGGTSHRALAAEYGVHHETIRAALTGRTW